MTVKRPRRTAERILDATLVLFNRFGEPNVSTQQLCAEIGISPGNLFYHHANREALVAGLLLRYQDHLNGVLSRHGQTPSANALTTPKLGAAQAQEAPWWQLLDDPALRRLAALAHDLAHASWAYRFLFRDLNDLVSRHRALEASLPVLLRQQAQLLGAALADLPWTDAQTSGTMLHLWAGHMLACLTGSIGLDGALDPREQCRHSADTATGLAVGRALGLVAPSLQTLAGNQLWQQMNHAKLLGPDPWLLNPAAG